MGAPEVLVVGETPSLGRSITDLLETENVRARHVLDLRDEGELSRLWLRAPVLVAASNGPFCTTARRWIRGEFPGVALVVVGSRDPVLTPELNRVHLVALPLQPDRFLGLIQELLDQTSVESRSEPDL